MDEKKWLGKEQWKTMLIVFVCILVNYFGKRFAQMLTLPVWLDSFGTVFSAYTLGPIFGAIVGGAGSIINAFWNPNLLAYGLVSIYIGLRVGFAARKGHFATFFHAMTLVGEITIGSVFIAGILNLQFSGGSIGNIWGDGVRGFLMDKGSPVWFSSIIGELYLEFLDKLVTILAMYLLIKMFRWYRKQYGKKNVTGIGLFLAVLFTGTLCTPVYVAHAAAESPIHTSFIHTIYSSDNGIPSGHVNDIAQTNDGVLWLGADSGLYKYNGNEFQFMSEFESVYNVNCLYVDAEGRLWIGTNDNGIVISINEKVANVLDGRNGLPSYSIDCIVQSADGEYYIGTAEGMVVVRLKTGISILGTIPEASNTVCVSADHTGYVAAVTDDGKLLLIENGEIVSEKSGTVKDGDFTCCLFDETGTLYVGTTKGKLITCQVENSSVQQERVLECTGLAKLNQIYQQEDGDLWVCADNGAGRIQENTQFQKQELGEFTSAIENMLVDYQGNFWFASSKLGLLRISESPFTELYHNEEGAVNTTKLWNGQLYIGTAKGLYIVEPENQNTVSNALTALLKEIPVLCIQSDSSENLWICTDGKGIVLLDKTGKIQCYDAESDGIGNHVNVCMELYDKTVAVGSDRGLSFIQNGRIVKHIPYGEEFGEAEVLCFAEAADGTLLVGTNGNGIARIMEKGVIEWITRHDGLGSGVILRMVPDTEKGNFFIITSNSICYMSGEEVKTLSNFPYSNNYDIVLDKDGEMFVIGSAGVYVLKRAELLLGKEFEYTVLNVKMGLTGTITERAWNDLDKEKNLYLSTDHGVFCLNLDEYSMQRRSYRLMVSAIYLDGERYEIERGMNLSISRDVQKIEFVPNVVNYTLADPTVSYYLEGYDSDWSSVPQSKLSNVVYTNLPSGEYVFHLAILDDATGKIMEESTYGFQKEKSIYDNQWFILYMIVVGGLFIGWFTWFLTRTQMQKTLELQQAKLSFALQQVQMGNQTILAIAKTVDAKDVRTSMHSQRVSDYSVLIAKKYGFSEEEQENLRKAALLHDIGKIAIPDSILNKPARLSEEEYAIMKTHVMRGAEILKDFTLIDHVVEGARFHHERYDGRGYPDGLAEKDIPLYGRIIAIADAFDAMTANRVYRQRQDFDYVLGELHKGRGTQFDPELLDIFLEILDNQEIDIDALYENNEAGGKANES